MLILSRAKVTVDGAGKVRVEGDLDPHTGKIARFVRDLGLRGVTIRHLFGKFRFSSNVDPGTQQRLRNFLFAECPLRRK